MARYQISHLGSCNDAIFMVVFFSSKTIVEWNFSLNRPSLYLPRHFYTICCNVDDSYTVIQQAKFLHAYVHISK